MTRVCRTCGTLGVSQAVTTACEACGEPYGRITFGFDAVDIVWQTPTDAARDAAFREEVKAAERKRIYDLASQPRDE